MASVIIVVVDEKREREISSTGFKILECNSQKKKGVLECLGCLIDRMFCVCVYIYIFKRDWW